MSGRGIVPILEEHGDVYVTGSTVVRHKQTSNGECDIFPTDHDVQLVLSVKSLYKLRHPFSLTPSLVWRESVGLIRAVVPLFNHPFHAWATARGEGVPKCNGFAIEYFNPNKPPKPTGTHTALMRFMRSARCQCVGNVFSDVQLTGLRGGAGGLRVREYHVGLERPVAAEDGAEVRPLVSSASGSAFLQQDWCYALQVTRMNYWHERLEDHLIEDPEIFQYQTFAMEFQTEGGGGGAAVAAHNRGNTGAARAGVTSSTMPLLCQLVLSTERLYVVPRHEAKLLSMELPLHHAEMRERWFTVGTLRSVSVDTRRGILTVSGTQQKHHQQQKQKAVGEVITLTLGFFDTAETEEAVLEIQRVWEFTHRNEDFPLADTPHTSVG